MIDHSRIPWSLPGDSGGYRKSSARHIFTLDHGHHLIRISHLFVELSLWPWLNGLVFVMLLLTRAPQGQCISGHRLVLVSRNVSTAAITSGNIFASARLGVLRCQTIYAKIDTTSPRESRLTRCGRRPSGRRLRLQLPSLLPRRLERLSGRLECPWALGIVWE